MYFDESKYSESYNSFGIGKCIYEYETIYIVNEFNYYGIDNNITMLESDFYIYNKDFEAIMIAGSKEIWQILFEMKKRHYQKYNPEIIRMEFKNTIRDLQKRINNYEKYIKYDDVKFISHPYLYYIGFYGRSIYIDQLFEYYTNLH